MIFELERIENVLMNNMCLCLGAIGLIIAPSIFALQASLLEKIFVFQNIKVPRDNFPRQKHSIVEIVPVCRKHLMDSSRV